MFVWLCVLGGRRIGGGFFCLEARGRLIAQGEFGESWRVWGKIKIKIKEKNWPEGL